MDLAMLTTNPSSSKPSSEPAQCRARGLQFAEGLGRPLPPRRSGTRRVNRETLSLTGNGPHDIVVADESKNTADVSTHDVCQSNGVIGDKGCAGAEKSSITAGPSSLQKLAARGSSARLSIVTAFDSTRS